MKQTVEEAAKEYASCEVIDGGLNGLYGIDASKYEPFIAGKSSVSCPLKPSDSTPLKHSTMPP